HVACVLLVAGEAKGQRVRVHVGASHQLVECRSITALGGVDELREVVPPASDVMFGHRTRPKAAGLPSSSQIGGGGRVLGAGWGRAWLGPGPAAGGATGSLCGGCAGGPSGSTSSSRCVPGRWSGS